MIYDENTYILTCSNRYRKCLPKVIRKLENISFEQVKAVKSAIIQNKNYLIFY